MKVVFLHGFTGAPSTFDAVRSRLEGHRFFAPVMGGHGLPSAPLAADFVSEVDRLAALIRASDFMDSVLCGYSLGARLALGLLIRHPDMFRRAVLVGVNPGLDPEQAGLRAMADDAQAERLERVGVAAFVDGWSSQALFISQQRLPEQVRDEERNRRINHEVGPLAASLRTLSLGRMPDWRPALEKIRVPVAFVAGEDDAKFSTIARRCAAVTPGAVASIVEGSGHNVVLEKPDAFASLLEREKA